MTALDEFGAEQYVLLTTFRRDGRAIPTAVWVVRDGEALAVWTPRGSGKVKRIRRSGEVIVAPCDVRGRPRGAAVPGHATLADPVATEHVRGLLRKKYALMARIFV